jgi:hypothetical protein
VSEEPSIKLKRAKPTIARDIAERNPLLVSRLTRKADVEAFDRMVVERPKRPPTTNNRKLNQ